MKISLLISSVITTVFFTTTIAFANAPAKPETESKSEGHSKSEHSFEIYQPHVANKSVATEPEKVTLLAPAFEAKVDGSTVLKWKASASADKYLVQLATDANFKWLVVNEANYTKTELEVKGLEKGKNYYWRVFAIKSNNEPGYMKSPATKSMFGTM